ncbi:MAG TPA: saccharopine dehydrogenase NADP-binding domain-containing protein [Solirubrobacteraceae bacterium]
MSADRPHDVVLLGATGFTGGLTAEYLAAHAGDTRWAIAGRNREKLAKLAERIGADVPTLIADSADPGSLRELAESTRVVITTVGPYISYGEPLVAACAAAGTDYVDLTGEPEFVDLMYVRHHAAAEASGARIVHACGFDSIPHDLGAQFTVEQLPEGVPLKVEGYVRAGGKPSGGTLASALGAFSRLREWRRVAAERKRLEPRSSDRKVSGVKGAPHRVDGLGWALPMPTIDPQIVLRSARALDRYGPDFAYGHYVAVKRLPVAVGLAGGTMGLMGLSQIPQFRKLLTDKLPSGQGPSGEERAKSWFKVRFLGEGGDARVTCEVSGGDPGYGETAKMLAESALCLAHDELPATSGQVTTAQAMGPVLRARLQRAGIDFSVVS